LTALRPATPGYEAHGLEASETAAAAAREHFGDRIVVGPLDTATFAPETFDLITLWDVIEHLQHPRQALATIRTWIRPDGSLTLLTPDFGSLTARLLGDRWPHLIRQHLFYFTRQTLTQMLEATGFTVVRRLPWIRSHSLGYLLKRAHVTGGARSPDPAAPPSWWNRLLAQRVPVTLFDDLWVIARKASQP
jgi:2-polyprenyl-3-methyl-5-hydroxy-6-metoxy-1,4-benzoquinol methylase